MDDASPFDTRNEKNEFKKWINLRDHGFGNHDGMGSIIRVPFRRFLNSENPNITIGPLLKPLSWREKY
jgi:hypothetical protein